MLKASLAACFVLALNAATAAESNSAPATSAATPAAPTSTPAAPSPAAIGYATTILNDIGVKGMLDHLGTAMLTQLTREVLATHPELKDPLEQSVQAVIPEFVKSEDGVIGDAAKFLAGQMAEAELKDVAAFYEGPTGKKFMTAQGQVAGEVAKLGAAWRDTLSTDMLARVREEMKKRGHDF
jgi:hypothetical protein